MTRAERTLLFALGWEEKAKAAAATARKSGLVGDAVEALRLAALAEKRFQQAVELERRDA